ncbi:MAG TPA: hypothetical protein VIX11_18435 [Candidatus Acidoferrum sp.]
MLGARDLLDGGNLLGTAYLRGTGDLRSAGDLVGPQGLTGGGELLGVRLLFGVGDHLSIELLLGPTNQKVQVLSIDSHFPAEGVLVLFLQEDGAKKVTVSLGHCVEDTTHLFRRLLCDEHALQIQYSIGYPQVGFLHGLIFGGRSVELLQNLVTDGVNERCETFWLPDAAPFAQVSDDSNEGLLP